MAGERKEGGFSMEEKLARVASAGEDVKEEEEEPLEQLYIRVLWLRPAPAYWRGKGGGGTGAGRGRWVAGQAHDQRPGWQPALPPANRRRSRGAQDPRGPKQGRRG